jgi:opacity protein-like surface antigen
MRRVVTILLTAIGLSASAAPSPAQEPRPRDHWTVGVAYGPGKARITGGDDSLTTGWLEGPAQAVRIGRSFGPFVTVGFEHQAWLREQGYHDLKIRAGTQLEALALTTHLGRPGSALGGLFVTAGAGYAHVRLTFLEPLAAGESAIGDTHEEVFKKDEFGWGGFGGLGYEFRISRSFHAGLLITYNYLDIGDEIYDTATFVPLLANLNWSF